MALDQVPDEIIRHVLYFLSPEENLATIQLLSKRFHHLADDPLLWKYYCLTSFKYWSPAHQLQKKLRVRASEVAWKPLWIERRRRNARVAELLDTILATKVGRVHRFEQICTLGYDAKDFLLEQCHSDESVDDVLARRYYANTALGSIHRSMAVEEWFEYQRTGPWVSHGLDRALAAFEMFFLYDQEEQHDIDDTGRLLDDLTSSFVSDNPHFDEKTLRQKALILLEWVRERNLTGMDDQERNYRNLRNCLIGHALRDEQHPSLPMVSSAIYCCLAERLGMRAACCPIPSHVHAMIMSPPGLSLDGAQLPEGSTESEKMFLDPYGSSHEVTLKDLRSRLVEFGWMNGTEAFLVPSPVPVIVQRMAQNMKATYHEWQSGFMGDERLQELLRLPNSGRETNMENVAYAAHWANLLMTPVSSFDWDNTLDGFLGRFRQQFSEDAWIVEKYLLPLYEAFTMTQNQGRDRSSWEDVQVMLGMVRNIDQRQPTVNRRYTQEIHQNVWYKVGQVFRHKRYNYIGIINGWGDKGTGSLPTPHNLSMEETIAEVEDDSFDRSIDRSIFLKKTFYTCLRSNIDRHVVAQDNIQIITDPTLIPQSLFYVAGKYFKRFDRDTCTFVSNLREFFPDD